MMMVGSITQHGKGSFPGDKILMAVIARKLTVGYMLQNPIAETVDTIDAQLSP